MDRERRLVVARRNERRCPGGQPGRDGVEPPQQEPHYLGVDALARARSIALRNSSIGAAPVIGSLPTKNVGVDPTPACRPRPRSALMSFCVTPLLTHLRHDAVSTPTVRASESKVARASGSAAQRSCVLKIASCMGQNLPCAAAHMAASAAGIACWC